MASGLELSFEFDGRKRLNDLGRALGRADRDIPRQVNKAIEKEQKENAKEAAKKVLQQPAKGEDGSTGLRKNVAKGVGVLPLGQNGHRVYTSMPEKDEAVIPLGLDTKKGWRHPLFGRKGKGEWFTQRGEFSWFM